MHESRDQARHGHREPPSWRELISVRRADVDDHRLPASASTAVHHAQWIRSARSADVGRRVLVWRPPGGGKSGPATLGVRVEAVLLWRARGGAVVAMDARCPHRQYLMTDARVVGDTVECPLHGYRFRADGRCVNARGAAPARSIDIREVDGYIWLRL